jgi:hypothetical protein
MVGKVVDKVFQVYCVLMSVSLSSFIRIFLGQNAVEYLFLQWKYDISLQEYALMNTLSDVFQGE